MLSDSVYKTPYPEYANKTFYWSNSDSEEKYKENLKNRYDDLATNNWIDTTIEYKYNSQGFRSEEFDNQPCVVFLGCSRTTGEGLPIENTFPYIVAKQLKLKCINLAIAGSANDSAYRIGSHYIPKLNTKLVIFNVIQSSRFEIIIKDKNFHFLSARSVEPQEKFYNEWISGEANMYLNMQKNIEALNFICNSHNMKFINIHSDLLVSNIDFIDLARDLSHPGRKCNELHAKRILNLL